MKTYKIWCYHMCICDHNLFFHYFYIYIAGLYSLVHVLFNIMFVYCRTPVKNVRIIGNPSFRLVKFVCPISFLVFPSRNVGRETPPLTYELAALTVLSRRKVDKNTFISHTLFCFIKILLGSNKITSYHEIIQF